MSKTIATKPVTSSQIAAVGYDSATKTLAIEFKTGGVYHYANVPHDLHHELITAKSVGSFFYKHIKPHSAKYPYTKQGGAK